ncbi:class I adenylate-forming enzyme family protein [Dactylosporangium sp. CA-092794]|uniref:class I adenylate-forming enzyme family protein n=1 Tax=Dactylosporangium sp. CA-092794 TaxID=3239929 RepID=UPI003D8E4707
MPTVASTLRTTARRVPGAAALSFGERTYTYAELDTAVDRTATALAGLGLGKGDRFALMGTNSDRFVIAFYAALRLGAIVVPVNPTAAPPELRYLLEDSGAAVLAHDPALAATARATPASTKQVLALDELAALSAATDPAPVPDTVAETDDSLILYTSGTTGKPKGALFDHHRTTWVAFNTVATCGMRVGDRFLHVAPLFHAAQLCIMLVPGTMIGAKHVILPAFQPAAVLDAMEAERITMFFGVPTMYQFLLRHPGAAERDLSAWRTGLFGAAPMPPSAVQRLTETWPRVNFIQLCGQTEGGPGGIYCDVDQVKARPDASGRQPLPLTEARVVDPEGNDIAPGGVGELLLRGETIMKGYWHKPAETADALRDGWLHTGDLARLDPDGYLTLVDRLKDLIITGGHNVYSVEVENALAAHPHITDVAVIARPHPDYGESIIAVITPAAGTTLTLSDVKAFCADKIADYKIPHDVVIDTIPRNQSGKILKQRLREQHAAAAER